MNITVDDNFGCKQLLKDILPNVHMIDIRVRMDGKYYWFEGDYLKEILRQVEYKQIDNDGIKSKLENQKQIGFYLGQVHECNGYAEVVIKDEDSRTVYAGNLEKQHNPESYF